MSRRRLSLSKSKKPVRAYDMGVPQPFRVELLSEKEHLENIKGFFRGEYEVAASTHKFGDHYDPLTLRRNTVGHVDVLKKGFGHVKDVRTGKLRQKMLVLEKGLLSIFDPKAIDTNNTMPTVLPPEKVISIGAVRAIQYTSRGAKSFILVFNDVNKNGKHRFGGYKFKFSKSSNTECWLAVILCEIKNQALALEQRIHRYSKKRRQDRARMEQMLRRCVDLFQLALGKYHKSTAAAQERLGKFLRQKPDDSVEAKFWLKSAQTTATTMRSLNQESTVEYLQHRTKIIRSDSSLNQLKFQTEAIYRLRAYKQKIESLRVEAQKWKARAILYGYGADEKAASDKRVSFPTKLALPTETVEVEMTQEPKQKLTLDDLEEVLPEDVKSERMPSVLASEIGYESRTTHEAESQLTRSTVNTLEEDFNTTFYLNKESATDAKSTASSEHSHSSTPKFEKPLKVPLRPTRRTKKQKESAVATKDTDILVLETEKEVVEESKEAKVEKKAPFKLETAIEEEKLKPRHKPKSRKKKKSVPKVSTERTESKLKIMPEVTESTTERQESVVTLLAPAEKPLCYLMISPANKGTLYVRWTTIDLSEHALARFEAPTEHTPQYTFNKTARMSIPKRDEIAYGVQNEKRLVNGIVLFLKLCLKHRGSVSFFHTTQFRIYSHSALKGRIEELDTSSDNEIDMQAADYDAIAVLPKSSQLFVGIKLGVKSQFMSRARKQGAAFDLLAGKKPT